MTVCYYKGNDKSVTRVCTCIAEYYSIQYDSMLSYSLYKHIVLYRHLVS